uniref:Uncharacterized protein n=1 Tax=Salix viminalis TaxID=40686 RepID=A0A6N2LBH4_SALVM
MLRISLWGKQGVCEVDLLPLRITSRSLRGGSSAIENSLYGQVFAEGKGISIQGPTVWEEDWNSMARQPYYKSTSAFQHFYRPHEDFSENRAKITSQVLHHSENPYQIKDKRYTPGFYYTGKAECLEEHEKLYCASPSYF